MCTVTCKWTYLAHERRWSDTFLQRIGLGDFAAEQYRRIGRDIVDAGTPLGSGLTAEAAAQLGLDPGTPVAAGLIAGTGCRLASALRVNPMGVPACAGLAALAFVGVALLRWPLVWVLIGLGVVGCVLAWRNLLPTLRTPKP